MLDRTVGSFCHETKHAPAVFVQILTPFLDLEVAFHLIVWIPYYYGNRYLVFTKKKGFKCSNITYFLKKNLRGDFTLLPGYY